MNAKKWELAIIALVAAICAGAAWTTNHELFTVVFLFESVIANIMTFL